MQSLSSHFSNLERDIFAVQDQLLSYSPENKMSLIKSLQNFKISMEENDIVLEGFSSSYFCLINKMFGSLKDLYNDPQIKQAVEQTFVELIGKNIRYATKLFDEFIKGISAHFVHSAEHVMTVSRQMHLSYIIEKRL